MNLYEGQKLSLVDHNDLITNALFVHRVDCAYFVLQQADQYRGVICSTYVDENNEPTELEVVLMHDFDTLQDALDYVLLQYDIDARDDYDYFNAVQQAKLAA